LTTSSRPGDHGGIPGGYDIVRQLMGDEGACIAFIEQGELVADISGRSVTW